MRASRTRLRNSRVAEGEIRALDQTQLRKLRAPVDDTRALLRERIRDVGGRLRCGGIRSGVVACGRWLAAGPAA